MKTSHILALAAGCAVSLAVMIVASVPDAVAKSAGRPPSSPAPNMDRNRCFDPSDIRNFESVDEHKMIIVSNRNEAYELSLTGPCMGIDTSFAIGIRSRFGTMDICGPFDGEILYREMGEEHLAQCSITEVKHLTGDAAAPYVNTTKAKRPS